MSTPPADLVRELMERLIDALDLDAELHVEDDGETVTARLVGEDLGLFIGRHGQTIDAVQHLAYRMVEHPAGGEGHGRRVVVDAAGYRERRRSVLEREADEAADEALQTGRPVRLSPMIASERKLVHEYLRERGGVETHSEGAEPARRLVVAPAGE